MRFLISLAALFASVVLLQLSSGGLGPLDALSGISLGFQPTQVGLLGSMHFVGFFVGCWWAPRLMGGIGHSRAFAAFAASGAIGIIGHTLSNDPYVWAVLRLLSGLTVAGCYTIIEGWLQAKVTNANRGRTLGAYRVVDMSGSLIAQLMIGVLEPAAYVSYNILAILCCLSLVPLTLTRVTPPKTVEAPRLRPLRTAILSPLGVAGVIVAGVSSASFRMVGPVYGVQVGLAQDQLALFLAAFVLGGAAAQYPAGWLADKFDRRFVLVGFSVAAMAACAATVAVSAMGTAAVFGAAILFGLTTFPIFSISAAHTADFAPADRAVEVSSAMIFWYAVGAIASPLVTSGLMDRYGPGALFTFIAGAHLLLIIFSLIRMNARPTATDRTAYAWMPRTSFTVGRLLRRRG